MNDLSIATQYYERIAQAEQAIMDAGYVRNSNQAIWVNAAGKRCKVLRDPVTKKFYISAN